MVRLLNMKKKFAFLEPIEDPCKAVLKKFKEKRTKILKQSLNKLKKIPDAEQCLRQAVLIRNTFIKAKDLSPKQFERQLLTQPLETLGQTHLDLMDDMVEQFNSDNKESHYYNSDEETPQSCKTDCSGNNDITTGSRHLVAVS